MEGVVEGEVRSELGVRHRVQFRGGQPNRLSFGSIDVRLCHQDEIKKGRATRKIRSGGNVDGSRCRYVAKGVVLEMAMGLEGDARCQLGRDGSGRYAQYGRAALIGAGRCGQLARPVGMVGAFGGQFGQLRRS